MNFHLFQMVTDLLATTADSEAMEESVSEELPSNQGEHIYSDVPQQSEDLCTISVTLDSQTTDAATQLTATAHELFPACDGSTQTPINWKWKGTQTNPVVRSRGKFSWFEEWRSQRRV